MNVLIEWLNKNHAAILFTVTALSITSVFMYFQLPKDVFPNADFPRFQIIADIGFSSLENTEINITRPLEEALKTVPDVVEVRSVTERGTSTIDLFLKWGTDLNQAYQQVQTKIGQARSALPPSINIDVVRMSPSAYPMSEYGIWSDQLDLKDLYTKVRYQVIPGLIGIDGIYGLTVIGGEEPEIWIKLDPAKLAARNIDTATIGAAIDDSNKISFLGNIIKDKSVFFAVGGQKIADMAGIGQVVIATRMGQPVYLKDIADIEDSHADVRRIVSVNGHKGLLIDVRKQQNADGLKISEALDARMAEIETRAAGKLHIAKWDLSDFVQGSIRGILFDIGVGIAIILLIVLSILRRFRYSLPIMLIIPIVIILEFLIMKVLGLTINIMTLGGLSAAIGIIADNAIVITENYVRFKTEGRVADPIAASLRYIAPITLWATVVSIIVFIPLNTLSGVPGLFFKPLALTLATTILCSLVMAIFVLPIFLKHFSDREEIPAAEVEGGSRLERLKKSYLNLLDQALRRRLAVAGGVALVALLGAFVFLRLPSGFLPDWDEGDVVLDYILPVGSSIPEADRISRRLEDRIKSFPEVKMFIRKTGTALSHPYLPPSIGEMIVLLNAQRKKSTFEVIDAFREAVAKDLPEVQADLHQILPDRLGDLTGVAKPVVINILGNDSGALWVAAQTVKEKLEKIDGLNGVFIDMPPPQKEVQVTARQDSLSLLGVGAGEAFHYSQLALYGEVVSFLRRGLQLIPIRELYSGDYRTNMESLRNIPVYTPNGGLLRLGKLAAYAVVDQTPEIHHKNGSLVISVNAEISGRALGDVVNDIKKSLSEVKADNLTLELAGNYKNQQTSFKELLIVLMISLILILTCLLFIFESYLTAAAVFIGTAASAAFVIFGLALAQMQFDVSSFTGMITVMGIVVNNGILVIYFVDRFRVEGQSIRDAVISAGDLRFRPVLITNLAAIAGFLPMALNLGHGGEVLRPFSVAMISGLIGSMFFSLVVMPVFYCLFHKETGSS